MSKLYKSKSSFSRSIYGLYIYTFIGLLAFGIAYVASSYLTSLYTSPSNLTAQTPTPQNTNTGVLNPISKSNILSYPSINDNLVSQDLPTPFSEVSEALLAWESGSISMDNYQPIDQSVLLANMPSIDIIESSDTNFEPNTSKLDDSTEDTAKETFIYSFNHVDNLDMFNAETQNTVAANAYIENCETNQCSDEIKDEDAEVSTPIAETIVPTVSQPQSKQTLIHLEEDDGITYSYKAGELEVTSTPLSKIDVPKRNLPKNHWILIDKSDRTLYLFKGHNLEPISSYMVAIGANNGDKQEVGDKRTPIGTFTVQSIENASKWTHDFKDGKGVIKGAYGPWFIRLKTGQWKGIGIHGTHDPSSIGKTVTEGCIRLHNDELQQLKKLVKKGMTVIIQE